MEEQEQELENMIRRGRIHTTQAQDQRILARGLAALEAAGPHKNGVRLALPAVTLVAVVVSFLVWIGTRAPSEENDLVREGNSEALGFLRTAGIDETLKKAALVAKLQLLTDIVGAQAEKPREAPKRVQAKIVTVFHGDSTLAGKTITIKANPEDNRLRGRMRSFLCVTNMQYLSKGLKGSFWIVPLVTAGKDYRNAFSPGLRGTRVPETSRPLRSGGTRLGADRLRDELLGALVHDKDTAVRLDSIAALRNWDGWHGGARDASDRLWKDVLTARRLLRTASDPDERVRWTLAWMIPNWKLPKSPGVAGSVQTVHVEAEATLFRLLFDPVRLVRQPAAFHLERRGHDDVAKVLKEITDYELDERTSKMDREAFLKKLDERGLKDTVQALANHEQWAVRARAAWLLGYQEPTQAITEALIEALEDPHFDVRRWAAWSLGRLKGKGAMKALLRCVDDEDGRVRVMVARSLMALGNKRGHEKLAQLTRGEDVRAAVQAVEALGAVGTKQTLDVLLAATKDERAAVRAFAAIHIVPCAKFARHQVESTLADLTKDDAPLVRIAARVARERMPQ